MLSAAIIPATSITRAKAKIPLPNRRSLLVCEACSSVWYRLVVCVGSCVLVFAAMKAFWNRRLQEKRTIGNSGDT